MLGVYQSRNARAARHRTSVLYTGGMVEQHGEHPGERPGPLTPIETDEDARHETKLRPRRLDQYFGQERIKESLRIAIEAARQRDELLDHLLFHGPPGLG